MKYFVYLLKGYNNYFNRIIKGYETIAEYLAELGAGNYFLYSKEVNYNPADNVSTKLVMNDCPFEPDYLIYVDDQSNIISRWFVMETLKTRQGQFEHTLRRDVIYDYHEGLLNSRVFIQKATLQENDPLILNSEGMSFNEIKTEETLLKDKTNCSWVVAYLAKNATPSSVSVQVASEKIDYIALSVIASDAGMTENELGKLINFDNNTYPSFFTTRVEVRYGITETSLTAGASYPFRARNYFSGTFEKQSYEINQVFNWSKPLFSFINALGNRNTIASNMTNAIYNNRNSILSNMSSITNRQYLTVDQLESLKKHNGDVVLYNGAYYTFKIEESGTQDDPVIGPAIYTSFPGFSSAIATLSNPAPNADGEISIRTRSIKAYVKLNLVSANSLTPELTLNIPASRNTIQDQAFDMIVINNGPIAFGDKIYTENQAIKLAMAIAAQLDANVYDVQLLPYCPMPDILKDDGSIDDTKVTENIDFDYVNGAGKFRAQKFINNSDWNITGTTATYTWVDAIPQNAGGTVTYHAENEIPGVTNIEADINGNNIEVTVTAQTLEQIYNLGITILCDWSVIAPATVPAGIVLYPKKASFSTVLNYEVNAKDNLKIESQCNKYRIVSPNYQGTFDFNVAKNGGKVSYFIAECTYKPYTPYIKVTPSFSWLYGANFGDNRGLICGGDFSIPRFTSAWETFQLNNKNYQNIFNREIQSLDLQQSIEMRNQLVGAAVGTLGQASSGALAGFASTGSPYGAIAGAAVGGIGGAVGGAIDTETLARLQRDQRSLAIDKYNYQLGNIKALPYTMTKVGAFDINSKIFPFLEFYTCTDEEKEALEEKIAFESMTVMRIGFFGTYYQAFDEPRYFKGELIRNTELAEDNHIFEAIYAELLKGVYI